MGIGASVVGKVISTSVVLSIIVLVQFVPGPCYCLRTGSYKVTTHVSVLYVCVHMLISSVFMYY